MACTPTALKDDARKGVLRLCQKTTTTTTAAATAPAPRSEAAKTSFYAGFSPEGGRHTQGALSNFDHSPSLTVLSNIGSKRIPASYVLNPRLVTVD